MKFEFTPQKERESPPNTLVFARAKGQGTRSLPWQADPRDRRAVQHLCAHGLSPAPYPTGPPTPPGRGFPFHP